MILPCHLQEFFTVHHYEATEDSEAESSTVHLWQRGGNSRNWIQAIKKQYEWVTMLWTFTALFTTWRALPTLVNQDSCFLITVWARRKGRKWLSPAPLSHHRQSTERDLGSWMPTDFYESFPFQGVRGCLRTFLPKLGKEWSGNCVTFVSLTSWFT